MGKNGRKDSVMLEPFRKVLLLSGLTKNTITCFTTYTQSVLRRFWITFKKGILLCQLVVHYCQ